MYYFYQLAEDNYTDVFGKLPSNELGSLLFYLGSSLILITNLYWWSWGSKFNRPIAKKLFNFFLYITVLITLFGSYSYHYQVVDEVAVNLEHPFNLFNHGLFSMSPLRAIDGTVEYLYYLLLTPFAAEPAELVLANFILGFIVTAAHLIPLKKIIDHTSNKDLWSLCALCFACFTPLMVPLASGFGNGLVSLTLMFAIAEALTGNAKRAAWIAAVLPLIRPDAVLYSWGFLLSLALLNRFKNLVGLILPTVGSIISLTIYFGLHQLYFGHPIPTPIIYKAVSLRELLNINPDTFYQALEKWASVRYHYLAGLSLLAIYFFPASKRFIFLSWLALFFAPIFIWYLISGQIHIDYTESSHERYWIGFELVIFLSLIFCLISQQHFFPQYLPQLLLIALILIFIQLPKKTEWQERWTNRSILSFAGELTERIAPQGAVIASSEMNGFGLGVRDKEVVDLWGYSNPEIAASKICDRQPTKVSPGIFARINPDIFFIYKYIRADYVEADLASYQHFSPKGNIIGDVNPLLTAYDLFAFAVPNQEGFALFVRKDDSAAVQAQLEKLSVKLRYSREIDRDKFNALYHYPGDSIAYRQCDEIHHTKRSISPIIIEEE